MNVRQAAYEFHKRKIFMNSIEYPAVPRSQQRFRISLMADHTKQDLDRLLEAVEEVWAILADDPADGGADAAIVKSRLSPVQHAR